MTPSVAFALEPFTAELFAEMLPLLGRHWREVAHYLDIPLEVNAGAYHAIAANGALRVFTARDRQIGQPCDGGCDHVYPYGWVPDAGCPVHDAQPLVGYAVFFVRPNPHYVSSLQAVQDVLFVQPESRGKTGAKLIAFADDALRAEGVQVVYQHVKARPRLNFGPMLERMGYELVDHIYAKRLDREGPR